MGCCDTSLERGRHPTSRSSRSQQDAWQWREMESPLRRRTAASIPWTATEAAELRASVDGVDSEAHTGTLSQPDRRCPARPPCPAAVAWPPCLARSRRPAASVPSRRGPSARRLPAWPRISHRRPSTHGCSSSALLLSRSLIPVASTRLLCAAFKPRRPAAFTRLACTLSRGARAGKREEAADWGKRRRSGDWKRREEAADWGSRVC